MALGGGVGGAGTGAIRAGRAFVEFFGKDAGVNTFLGKLQKRLRATGQMFRQVGLGMAGVGGLAGASGLAAVVGTLGEMTRMKAVADAFGMTEEAASGLFGMLAMNGGEFKEDMEGITQFSQRIADALAGVGGPMGEAGKLFQGLSVSAKDLVGLPIDEQFFRVHEAIRELPQGLQASRLALIGGTDSLKKWLPLLARSTDELRAQAKAAGMSADDMQEAQAATRAYQLATLALTQVWRKVAVAVAPVVEKVANNFTAAAAPVREFLGQNKALVLAAFGAAAGVAGLGVALVGIGVALSLAATGLGLVAGAVSLLASPLGFVALGVALAAVSGRFGDMGAAWRSLGETFEAVGGRIQAVFSAVSDAIQAGDLTLAIRVLAAGVKLEFLKLTNSLEIAVDDLMARFANSFSGESMGVQLRAMRDKMASGFENLFDDAERERRRREIDDKAMAELKAIQSRRGGSPLSDVASKEYEERIFRPELAAFNELQALVQQAKQAAFMSTLFWGNAGAGGAGGPKPPPDLDKQMQAVRGAFVGFGSLKSVFGGGGATKPIVEELKKANVEAAKQTDALGEMIDALRGNDGFVWGF
jgi:hypothetical protein